MSTDPRCPHCSEKVSATATWCMHCGRDFDQPVEASNGGRLLGSGQGLNAADLETALESGDIEGTRETLERSDNGSTLVGIGLGLVALVTLPIVSPGGVTLWYLLAVVGIGYVAADQSTVDGAIRIGSKALVAAPFLLWFVAALVGGPGRVGVTSLLGPIIYAGVVTYVTKKIGRR